MWPVLWTAAMAATGLHLEEASAVSETEITNIQDALTRALETIGRTDIRIDTQRSRCAGRAECIREIQQRTGAERVVVYALAGGVTKTLVVAELFESGARRTREQIEVPQEAALFELDPLLRGLVAKLVPVPLNDRAALPAPTAAGLPLQPSAAPAHDSSLATTSIVLFSAAAVSCATGIVFGVRAADTRAELGSEPQFGSPASDAVASRAEREQIAATSLLISGAVMAMVAIAVELVD